MTSANRTTASERAARIELTRARAALERQAVARDVRNVAYGLHPRAILHSFMPRMSSGSPVDWLTRAVTLTRRYPLLMSGASALLSSVGRRKGKRGLLWRVGAGLLLAWQIKRKAEAGRDPAPDRDIRLSRGRIR